MSESNNIKFQFDRNLQELWIIIGILVFVYGIYLLKDNIRIYWTVSRLNGPPTLPLLGNAHYVYHDDSKFFFFFFLFIIVC